jgi:solute carrier family 45 protein 1/2/4
LTSRFQVLFVDKHKNFKSISVRILADEQAKGLSTFTIMAGMGGSLGYLMGGVNWQEITFFSSIFSTNVQCLFTLVLIIEIVCLVTTMTSFPEVPLGEIGNNGMQLDEIKSAGNNSYSTFETENNITTTSVNNDGVSKPYIPISHPPLSFGDSVNLPQNDEADDDFKTDFQPTVKYYLKTIVNMPYSLFIVSLTNFFSWGSLVCYSLYFTDFVGEIVYKGDPTVSYIYEL